MKKYAIGADIGGTNIKFVIIDDTGKIIDYYETLTEADKGRKIILKNLISGITYLLNKNKRLKISGIGVGSPGLVNAKGKVVTGAGNLTGWNGTKIKQEIEKAISLPVFADNDVTALALGEAMFGAGKGCNNLICAALGTGLGGGIIINQKIYRGKYGYAAEFGHIVVEPDGAPCSCGKRGCLETYASAWGLKRLAKQYLNKKNKKSLILKLAQNNIENITPKIIFDAYIQGDEIADKILNKMGYYLGLGLSILVNIFDPDIIIIAGGISQAGRPLVQLIYKYIYEHSLPFYKNRIKIKLSRFKHRAGAIGSASLVFEKGV